MFLATPTSEGQINVEGDGEGGGVSEDGVESGAGRSSDVLAEVRQWRGGECRPRLDPPALHERQQLVGDLGQDVFGQPGHAEDLVPRPVDVVSERDELKASGQEEKGSALRILTLNPSPIAFILKMFHHIE